jgi:hypothetical protein
MTENAIAVVRKPTTPVKVKTPKPAESLTKKAGRAIGHAGKTASESIVQSLKQEEPKTLAKLALAAVAPKLIEGAMRFALRNPVTTIIGVLVLSSMIYASSDTEAA